MSGKSPRSFWVANGVLALAMLMLFFMGPLSRALGIWAVVLWMLVAGFGMVLLMRSGGDEPPPPD